MSSPVKLVALSNLIPKKFWGSRLDESTSEFKRLEFKEPKDMLSLAIDDNMFIKADSESAVGIPEEFYKVLKSRLQDLKAELVLFCWIAPKQ